jgi:hypothetical protein
MYAKRTVFVDFRVISRHSLEELRMITEVPVRIAHLLVRIRNKNIRNTTQYFQQLRRTPQSDCS